MLNVQSRLKAYEVDGAEPHLGGPGVSITVHAHWNRDEFVVLEQPDGVRLTVLAADLRAAIENAQNSGKK